MKKGHTNNPHGRPKGIPNKTTAEMRRLLKVVVSDYFKADFARDFAMLEPRDRIAVMEKLLKYFTPTLGALTVDAVLQQDNAAMLDAMSDDQLHELANQILNDHENE